MQGHDTPHHRQRRTERKPAPQSPSPSTKIIVWGGVALGIAGLTAGTILASRRLADLMADKPRKTHCDGSTTVKAAHTGTGRRTDKGHKTKAARDHRPQRRDAAAEMAKTANNLSSGLNGLTDSLGNAFHGFRRVASEAGTIIAEFTATADQLRKLMRHDDPDASQGQRKHYDPDDRRRHQL